MAPIFMGQNAKPMFALEGISSMQDKLEYGIHSIDRFGDDVRMILKAKD
jgi:diaminohydroxyphosphoribosylaminopyrimidine deaminase/5-amino-6-(5-phosphoribosylamino)uracil reductase